tara:strand:+ start:13250 stop:13771 length:522 start_codon:yes stop_codon:yes gene_type:complete
MNSKISKYMPTGRNADGSPRRRRVASVKRAEQLLSVVIEHQGKHPQFYNDKCNFSNQERQTAERFLIEDGIIVKTGNRRGSKLWLNPKTQEMQLDFDKSEPEQVESTVEPVPVVQGRNQTIVFSGFPVMLADRCVKLEERVFYLEAALAEYIEGNLTLNQLKQVYGELQGLRD